MSDTAAGRRMPVRIVVAGAVAGALLCTGTLWRTTGAMFGDTTTNSSSWSAGSVTVTDDDAGSALFDSTRDGVLTGGQTLTRCILVTYTGSVTSGTRIRLYADASGTLAGQLDLTVDEGTGGSSGDCSGFSPTTPGLYTGTLASFATAASSFASGVGSWEPSATPDSRTYRFTASVRNTVAARNAVASGTFTWEARV
ncbi:hypothetical protein KIH74_18640 [Kineosporia sp. J2-2]|uniref:SipW-cognate class signal peptide n=1 Tax=Kineosporia corallincola TaxID=2835133 RepID=A0ABS5TJE4_9ACTN|nr:hypothetical protein [Kineosporia corallincola]MBT0770963.1 hypothetical protein [Kineosporia corallincola]